MQTLFRQEHSSDITLYEAAVKFLREKPDGERLPNLKTLKTEKAKLLEQKKQYRKNIVTTGTIRKNFFSQNLAKDMPE